MWFETYKYESYQGQGSYPEVNSDDVYFKKEDCWRAIKRVDVYNKYNDTYLGEVDLETFYKVTGKEAKNEEKTAGVVETRIYTLEEFKKCKDIVKDGDGVKLPKIIVEAKTIDGNGRKMNFPFLEIQDTARVIKNENGKIDLVFQHCLFESAIDYNGIDEFDATQLGIYLAGEFLKAMQAAGIPAAKCGLLSKDEVFGDNALPFFKDGRNRIAFDLEEKEMWSYWLSTLASSVIFCRANDYGSSYYANASYAHSYVRPRFVIE